MENKMDNFLKAQMKTNLPEIQTGDTVLVSQKNQTFEGIVIAKKHGKKMGSTIIVRKVIAGVAVERIFPLHSPTINTIEVLRHGKARRAKLYYLRTAKGKKGKLKQI